MHLEVKRLSEKEVAAYFLRNDLEGLNLGFRKLRQYGRMTEHKTRPNKVNVNFILEKTMKA
jgi:hypothetical protein